MNVVVIVMLSVVCCPNTGLPTADTRKNNYFLQIFVEDER
jgi:hypothetical protein